MSQLLSLDTPTTSWNNGGLDVGTDVMNYRLDRSWIDTPAVESRVHSSRPTSRSVNFAQPYAPLTHFLHLSSSLYNIANLETPAMRTRLIKRNGRPVDS